MTYVRSCIAALLVLCNLITRGVSEPHYQLTLDRQKNHLHCTLTSASASLCDLTIPYKDTQFTQPIKKHSHLSLSTDKKQLQLAFTDKQDVVKMLITPDLNLTLNELAIEGSCTITLRNATTRSRIATAGRLSVKKDFLLESTGTRVVTIDDKRSWDIGGTAQFSLPQAAIEVAGRITAQGKLSLTAHSLTMPYGKTKQVSAYAPGNTDYCHSYVSQKASDHALLHSKQGDVVLDLHHAHLDGSNILAHRQVIISFQDYLKNLSVELEHMECRLKGKKIEGWFGPDYVNVAKEHDYTTTDPAVIQAGQAVIITMGTETSIYDRDHKEGTRKLARLKNTGRIEGIGLVDIASYRAQGALYNKAPSSARYTNDDLLRLALEHHIPAAYKKEAGTKDPFKYVHPWYDHEEPLRPLAELGFSEVADLVKGTEPLLLSPMLEAETLFTVLSNQGLPLLDGPCSTDYYCLLNQLQDNGFWYALVNGQLREISTDQRHYDLRYVGGALSSEVTDFYKVKAQTYYGAARPINKIKGVYSLFWLYQHPEKLDQRLKAIKSGKYRAELPEDAYERALIPLIYYRTKSIGKDTYVVPVLHLPTQTTIDSHTGSVIKGNNVNIHDMAKVVNTGTIHAINKLKIEAQQVVNEGVKRCSIKVPLPGGQLIGFTVEVVVPKDALARGTVKPGISSLGGTIFATHKVLLNAQQGDILLATHGARWSQQDAQKFFAATSPSGTVDVYPGRITGRDVDIIAQAGYLINHGTQILGNDNVHLKAFKDIIFKTLASVHEESPTEDLSIENITEEALNIQRASATALHGSLTLTSIDGSILDQSGTYQAQGTIRFDAKKGIKSKPVQVTLNHDHSWTGMGLFALEHARTTTKTQHTIPSVFHAGGDIYLKSGKDNILEAVILHSGGVIHLSAQRDTIIKGAQERSVIDTTGWSFGVSFFGSEAVKQLAAGQYPQAAWALADEDPLLAHLYRLKDTTGWNTLAEGTYTSIDAWKAFLQYCESAKNNGSKARLFAQRLGLTNSAGTFAPQLRFTVARQAAHTKTTTTRSSEVKAEALTIESGHDILLLDGTKMTAKKATFKGENLHTTPAVHDQASSEHTQEVTIGLNSVGAATHSRDTQNTVSDNAHLDANKVVLEITQNAHLEGINVRADEVNGTIGGNFTLESPHNAYTGDSVSASAFVGAVVGGSVAFEEENKENIAHPASIDAAHVDLKIQGTAHLDSSVIKADAGTIAAQTLTHTDGKNIDEKFGLSLGSAISQDDPSGIPGTVEFGITDRQKEQLVRATIAKNIAIKTTNDISDLNRDLDRIQGELSQTDTSFRLVIPIVHPERLHQAVEDVRAFLKDKRFITSTDFKKARAMIDEAAQEDKDTQKIEEKIIEQEKERIAQEAPKQQETASASQETQTPVGESDHTSTEQHKEEASVHTDEPKQEDDVYVKQELVDEQGQKIELETIRTNAETNTHEEYVTFELDPTNPTNIIISIKNDKGLEQIPISLGNLQSLKECFEKYGLAIHDVSSLDKDVQSNDGVFVYVDEDMPQETRHFLLKTVSVVLDHVPLIGTGKGLAEAVLGQRLETLVDPTIEGNLSPMTRFLSVVVAFLPFVKKVDVVAPYIEQVETLLKKGWRQVKIGYDKSKNSVKKAIGWVYKKPVIWDMAETGRIINGRYYTKHALERMAPNTLETRAALTTRALKKGYAIGSEDFMDYVNPRGIPPMVVEHTIRNGIRTKGVDPFTWKCTTNEIRVIINDVGDVVTIHPLSSLRGGVKK